MQYTNLLDMRLSQIVLGTDGYSQRIDKKTAFQLMECYVENGGNIIDTARMYCDGKSEAVVGEFVRGIGKKVYISTKCSHPLNGDMTKSRLDEKDIVADVDCSLRTMGIDCIDIIWLHRDDVSKAVEPIIDALNRLVKCGKIRYFGASNWSHDRIMEANRYAKATNQMGFCASQALYNMAKCSRVWDDTLAIIAGEEKSKYDQSHMPVFAFSSQAKGFFEKYATGSLSEKAKDRYLNDGTIGIYNIIKARAESEHSTISHTALKMLSEQSNFDVFPIIGPTNISQLRETLNLR